MASNDKGSNKDSNEDSSKGNEKSEGRNSPDCGDGDDGVGVATDTSGGTGRKKEEDGAESREGMAKGKGRGKAGRTVEGIPCRKYKYRLGCGSTHVIVCRPIIGGRIVEVFCVSGKSGGCSLSFTQALGKAVSTALTRGVDPREMVRMLGGISCNNGQWNNGIMVHSCSDAIAKALMEDMKIEGTEGEIEDEQEEAKRAGEELQRQIEEREELGLRG